MTDTNRRRGLIPGIARRFICGHQSAKWRNAKCRNHPDRKVTAKGLCKSCHRKSLPSNHKEHNLRKNYGMSLADHEELRRKQDNRCAICGEEFRTDKPGKHNLNPQQDHDHKTGKNRGLLCRTCNVGLGAFKDSPDLLRRATQYLEKYDQTEEATS